MDTCDIVERLERDGTELCVAAAAEITRLRAAVTAAEAALAVTLGSLARAPGTEPPFRVTDAAPTTPR